jgi:hypothetical protein
LKKKRECGKYRQKLSKLRRKKELAVEWSKEIYIQEEEMKRK